MGFWHEDVKRAMLDKTTTVNLLFDYYQPLLKENQKEYLELYYIDDLSLGEIAELRNISRQAVYDQIRKAEKVLFQWEEKLRLYEKDRQRQDLIHLLEQEIDHRKDVGELKRIIAKLREID